MDDANALAEHRPILAVFATPVYCISRFCGPVTDAVEKLSHEYANRAEFIHVEICGTSTSTSSTRPPPTGSTDITTSPSPGCT